MAKPAAFWCKCGIERHCTVMEREYKRLAALYRARLATAKKREAKEQGNG